MGADPHPHPHRHQVAFLGGGEHHQWLQVGNFSAVSLEALSLLLWRESWCAAALLLDEDRHEVSDLNLALELVRKVEKSLVVVLPTTEQNEERSSGGWDPATKPVVRISNSHNFKTEVCTKCN